MSSEIIIKDFIFNDQVQFQCEVLVIEKADGEQDFWFKGKNIAEFLEYKLSRKAILDHVDVENRKYWKELVTVLKWNLHEKPKNMHPNTVFINELGLYSLIFKSQKKEAKLFCNWVAEKVLVPLRKNGFVQLKNQVEEKDARIEELTAQMSSLQASVDLRVEEKINEKIHEKINEELQKYRTDIIAKTESRLLQHTLVIHKILCSSSYYLLNFTRRQNRTLATATKRILENYPKAEELLRTDVPNGVNILNVLKEKLRAIKIPYKPLRNTLTINLEDIDEQKLLVLILEILHIHQQISLYCHSPE